MRKLGTIFSAMLILAAMAWAAPKPSTPDRPFPAVLKNARFVYVAAYDGDQFDPNLFPQDREAIGEPRASEADIVVLVQSRPSEDVLAVYDAHMRGGQYLWRTMGRDGLQTGETPMATQFEKGFESVQTK